MQFNETLDLWSESLAKQIAFYRNAGKKVYVIALSRKMPRFFDWLKEAVASGTIKSHSVKKLCKMLESEVEITTEYAIPLIFKGYSRLTSEKIAGIIADDVIIFGATLQRVSMQWWAFSGNVPYVISLFRGMKGVIAAILESESTLKLPRLKDGDLESVLDIISRNIHSTSLPIDVEYPLIYSDLPYEKIKKHIQDNCLPEWETYDVKSTSYDDLSESFSVIIVNGRSIGLTNDHAKIRLFKKSSGCCLEMISPSNIRVGDLKKRELFSINVSGQEEKSKYSDAWLTILDSMHVRAEEASTKSIILKDVLINRAVMSTLVIWAEYLYCFSAFIVNKSKFFPQDAHPYVKKEDLALILGNNPATHVIEDIKSIITSGETIKPSFDDVTLQEYVNPMSIKDRYMRKVYEILKEGVSISDNLDALFRISHFSGEICKAMYNKNLFGHHCIGESFESLVRKTKDMYPKEPHLLNAIHRWVDIRIDECRIAPKYEIVVGSDGQRYFRRFFLCGSNKI